MSKVNKSTKKSQKTNDKKNDNIKEDIGLEDKNDSIDLNKTDKSETNVDTEETKKETQMINKNLNLHSPYINTSLVCPIMIFPNQMDNKMYLHLKDNLSNKLVGRCYKNYGYIVKIYKIDEVSDGVIEPEDPTCSAKLSVKFSCKLCNPAKNKEIIFKIDRMNKALIGGINGPLQAIITPDKINKEKFYPDNNRNIRIRGSSDVLRPDMYIRVLVLSSSFSDYEKNILVIGFLQDVASEEEYKQFMENSFE